MDMYIDYTRSLIIIAVVPAIALMVYIFSKDKVEKEPAGLLLKLALLGVVSTFLATATEWLGSLLISGLGAKTLAYMVVENFIVVGLSEEFFKYIVMKKVTWNDKAFNYTFDAVVYAVFVSLGFALWENILYSFSYGMTTALVRAVTSIPGHATFGVFMGLYYGLAKKADVEGRGAVSKSYRLMAVVIPVLLHGAYDFIASCKGILSTIVFIGFIAVLFFSAFRSVNRMSERDSVLISADDTPVSETEGDENCSAQAGKHYFDKE